MVASLLYQAKEVTSEEKVNLDKFVLSYSSTHREGNTSIKNKARDVKRKFSEVIETNAELLSYLWMEKLYKRPLKI